jgi:hypothetical protein
MANKKVSQLSATTEANNGVWLIMNNSGNTETFRIKREDLLSGTTTPAGFIQGDASQSLVPYYFETSAATAADTTYVDKLFSVGSKIDATDDSVVINSTGTSAVPSGKPRNAVISSIDGVISSSSNDGTNTILGTYQGTISAGGVGSLIAGGGSEIKSSASLYNTIVGGQINAITAGARNSIFGGYYADITSGGANVIVGGTNSQLTGGNNSAMLGGANNASTHTNSVMLGGASLTSLYDNTAHAEHLLTYGQISNGYYDNLSGDTFTIDWNNGNSQKVYMTGNTTLDFTNVRNGATYKLQVVNGGTHTITGATASGYTILCEGGNIPNITNNGVDLCILEVMGTDILVRHFADFSAP